MKRGENLPRTVGLICTQYRMLAIVGICAALTMATLQSGSRGRQREDGVLLLYATKCTRGDAGTIDAPDGEESKLGMGLVPLAVLGRTNNPVCVDGCESIL